MGASRLPLRNTKYGGKRFVNVNAHSSCQPLNHINHSQTCSAYSTMHRKTANVADPPLISAPRNRTLPKLNVTTQP